uniref:Auxin-responsive protein n=1 Tax=Aegilops tauschii TaxID=37682 RepID=R7W6W2_AEGTA
MDGTPYLRKVDVAAYSDYLELLQELNAMFYCCSIGLMDGYGQWEHAVVYEDGDGDWMLVGDDVRVFVQADESDASVRGERAERQRVTDRFPAADLGGCDSDEEPRKQDDSDEAMQIRSRTSTPRSTGVSSVGNKMLVD